MPSSFKTDKLQLNFWANIDRPVRSDFNRDNAIIDSAVGDHIENTLVHLTDDDRSKLRDTYQIRVLQGTDEDVRELTLSFSPSVVIYYAVGKPPVQYSDDVLHCCCKRFVLQHILRDGSIHAGEWRENYNQGVAPRRFQCRVLQLGLYPLGKPVEGCYIESAKAGNGHECRQHPIGNGAPIVAAQDGEHGQHEHQLQQQRVAYLSCGVVGHLVLAYPHCVEVRHQVIGHDE